MAHYKNIKPSERQLDYMRNRLRVDFEKGLLYWKFPESGKSLYKPIGCKDSNGYIKVQIDYFTCYAHQVIWYLFYGEWPETLIDHDNRDRADNRPKNLLLSNHSKNALNSKVWSTNRTGVKGVSLVASGQFKVTICGKFLGYYDSLDKAKEVADENYRHLAAC